MIMLFHNYDSMSYDYLPPPLRSVTSLREHVTSGRGFFRLTPHPPTPQKSGYLDLRFDSGCGAGAGS